MSRKVNDTYDVNAFDFAPQRNVFCDLSLTDLWACGWKSKNRTIGQTDGQMDWQAYIDLENF